jgi:hypothetical protein
MNESPKRPGLDYNVGLVLIVLGGFILVFKLKILAYLLKLWPVALIWLGWRMYRRADEEERTA